MRVEPEPAARLLDSGMAMLIACMVLGCTLLVGFNPSRSHVYSYLDVKQLLKQCRVKAYISAHHGDNVRLIDNSIGRVPHAGIGEEDVYRLMDSNQQRCGVGVEGGVE